MPHCIGVPEESTRCGDGIIHFRGTFVEYFKEDHAAVFSDQFPGPRDDDNVNFLKGWTVNGSSLLPLCFLFQMHPVHDVAFRLVAGDQLPE